LKKTLKLPSLTELRLINSPISSPLKPKCVKKNRSLMTSKPPEEMLKEMSSTNLEITSKEEWVPLKNSS
jgi:hypothetical protein